MSRILYFDCFSGASGDMVLGALLDAGLPFEELRAALGSLAADAAAVSARKVMRSGLSATKFSVDEETHRHDHADTRGQSHGHTHAHGHSQDHAPVAVAHAHGHRTLAEINAPIEGSALSAPGKTRARELFLRLGEVEAAIHQMPLEK